MKSKDPAGAAPIRNCLQRLGGACQGQPALSVQHPCGLVLQTSRPPNHLAALHAAK